MTWSGQGGQSVLPLGLSCMPGSTYLEVEIKGSHHVYPLRKALQGRGQNISLQAISCPSYCQDLSLAPAPAAWPPAA